jgi:hypothetical protein
MIGSSRLRCYLAVVLGLICLVFKPLAAVESVTIGQGGDFDWRFNNSATINTIQAEYLAPPDPDNPGATPDFLLGNTPGELLEIDNPDLPLSIHPIRIQECLEGTCPEANIANAAIARGGRIRMPTFTSFSLQYKTSDFETDLEEVISSQPGGEEGAIEFKSKNAFGQLLILDLGARFGANRIRFYPRNTVQKSPATPFASDFLRAYESFTNDGIDLTPAGNQVWAPLNAKTDNKQPVIDILIDPPRYVQSIRLKSLTQFEFEIDEIEVYGLGYLPIATYLSNIFDADEPVTWIDLSWVEDIVGDPNFSELKIRTRTGTDDSPFRFTRKLRGKPGADELFSSLDDSTRDMTRSEYERLPKFDEQGREWEPGSVQSDLVNWSPFSTPFDAAVANGPGSTIVSPSPRRYFQFQVEFQSKDLGSAHILQALSFNFSQPIADAIIGEIFPRTAAPSESLSFVYALKSNIQTPGVLGFDTVQISTQSRVEGIDRLELLDRDDQLLAARDFTNLEDTSLVDGFQILFAEDKAFAVRFPLIREDGAQLRIHFRTSVLTYSTNFSANVSLSTDPGAAQTITSGNAALLGVDDNPDFSGTTVLSPQIIGGGLLAQVDIAPAVFTPNGDNINDEVSVRYSLLSVSALRPVNISVYDLSGRLVRILHNAPTISGRYEDTSWNGRDQNDQLVVPGIYLVRISTEGDAKTDEQLRLVSVAY